MNWQIEQKSSKQNHHHFSSSLKLTTNSFFVRCFSNLRNRLTVQHSNEKIIIGMYVPENIETRTIFLALCTGNTHKNTHPTFDESFKIYSTCVWQSICMMWNANTNSLILSDSFWFFYLTMHTLPEVSIIFWTVLLSVAGRECICCNFHFIFIL